MTGKNIYLNKRDSKNINLLPKMKFIKVGGGGHKWNLLGADRAVCTECQTEIGWSTKRNYWYETYHYSTAFTKTCAEVKMNEAIG